MERQSLILLAADAILLTHAALVLFVVLALPLILLGAQRGWNWIRNPVFRYLHLALVIGVAAQAWAGQICPLTVWEMQLRAHAGATTYDESFVAYWVSKLLYYDASPWVFTALYSGFAVAVIVALVMIRPRNRHQHSG